MTTEIEITATVDPQQIYDSLRISEQDEFILNNLKDLEDDSLIKELENRGYTVTLEEKPMTREEEIKQAALKRDGDTDFDSTSGLDGFIEGAEWTDENPKSPWISIEEQLPAQYELVLVRTHIGSFYLAEKESFAQPRDEFAIPQLSSYINGVTHWMPIPVLE